MRIRIDVRPPQQYTVKLPDKIAEQLFFKSCGAPIWHDGKLLVIERFLDPETKVLTRFGLTSAAYFETTNLTPLGNTEKRYDDRRSARFALDKKFTLNIYNDMIRVDSGYGSFSSIASSGGGGLRGNVAGFSRSSRKRMLEFMAKVRYDTQLIFLTLTYPDEFPVDDRTAWNLHFEALRRRLEYHYPKYCILWRKEMKRRKSGTNAGKRAPHYHFMIFTDNENEPEIEVEKAYSYGKHYEKTVSPLSNALEQFALSAWSAIVDSKDERHTEHGAFAVAIRNRRHAYKYIAKYVAKIDNDDLEIGRRWGRIGKFNVSESQTLLLSDDELIELKRYARKWKKKQERTNFLHKLSLHKSDPSKNKRPQHGKYHKAIANSNPYHGFTLLGLGDGLTQHGKIDALNGRVIIPMIYHAKSLVIDNPKMSNDAFSGLSLTTKRKKLLKRKQRLYVLHNVCFPNLALANKSLTMLTLHTVKVLRDKHNFKSGAVRILKKVIKKLIGSKMICLTENQLWY